MVTISDSTNGAVIYYTTDSTTPRHLPQNIQERSSVSSSETLEAIAIAPGYSQSAVATAAYTINPYAPLQITITIFRAQRSISSIRRRSRRREAAGITLGRSLPEDRSLNAIGIYLASDGTLAGIPTATGTYPFIVAGDRYNNEGHGERAIQLLSSTAIRRPRRACMTEVRTPFSAAITLLS